MQLSQPQSPHLLNGHTIPCESWGRLFTFNAPTGAVMSQGPHTANLYLRMSSSTALQARIPPSFAPVHAAILRVSSLWHDSVFSPVHTQSLGKVSFLLSLAGTWWAESLQPHSSEICVFRDFVLWSSSNSHSPPCVGFCSQLCGAQV